jgi:SAM-dependent methyltransferase
MLAQNAGRYGQVLADYAEIFRHRGGSYHKAMLTVPHARVLEFKRALEPLIADLAARPAFRIADAPSGGEYLRSFLPATVEYHGFDPSSGFNTGPAEGGDLADLPFPDLSIDAFISLAGLHHCLDKRPFLNACHRTLVPRGLLSVLDVGSGSPEARFLDEFVGKYNGMGHEGDYLGPGFVLQFEPSKWDVLSAGMVDCHWQFASKTELCEFCRGLFRLQGVSDSLTLEAVRSYLGVKPSIDSQESVQMPWRLYRVVARKCVPNPQEH